jgi:shikimate dehydrogenase
VQNLCEVPETGRLHLFEISHEHTMTDRYAVIGHPISHSRSPVIHKIYAADTGEDISYEAIDIAPKDLRDRLKQFVAEGGRGLNVTVPHKQEILELMDTLTERAQLAGAVNTVICKPSGELEGDNTDGLGLIADLHNLGVELVDASVLILGAGGATRGIIPPIMEHKPAAMLIANRTPEKAQMLANAFADMGNISACGFSDLKHSHFNLVINATSAGLDGELPPFPTSILDHDTVCYDLSYSMRDTPFVAWAREHGCEEVYQGWGMLIEQAAESFAIWRGVRPDTRGVRERLP